MYLHKTLTTNILTVDTKFIMKINCKQNSIYHLPKVVILALTISAFMGCKENNQSTVLDSNSENVIEQKVDSL